MSENIGKIGWIDMTVEDASGLRDFYQKVVGWNVEDTSMGDYSDYTMRWLAHLHNRGRCSSQCGSLCCQWWRAGRRTSRSGWRYILCH